MERISKAIIILVVLLFTSCTARVTPRIKVIGVISAPGLSMNVDNAEDKLKDHLVVVSTEYITRGLFNMISNVEYSTFIGPLYSFEDPNDYQPNTILRVGYINGKKGLFPEGKLKTEGTIIEEFK
jgi:hypothetical protein